MEFAGAALFQLYFKLASEVESTTADKKAQLNYLEMCLEQSKRLIQRKKIQAQEEAKAQAAVNAEVDITADKDVVEDPVINKDQLNAGNIDEVDIDNTSGTTTINSATTNTT